MNQSYKHILTLLIVILIHNKIFSQNRIIDDLNIYRQTISNKHINPFTKISKEYFNKRIDTLISNEQHLNREQVVIELMKINALINDEHSIVFPKSDLCFPLQFKLFDDGVVAVTVADSAYSEYLLHRVVSINDMPITKLLSNLKSIIKQDNPSYSKSFEQIYINNISILQGFDIVKDLPKTKITLLSPRSDTVVTFIPTMSLDKKINWNYAAPYNNLLAYKQRNNYWFDYSEKDKILYFNYRKCTEEKDENFATFNNRLFDYIEKVKPRKLIVDFRFNSGGNSSIFNPFISSIKKSYLNTDTSFYILIGPTVMSSALMNAVDIKKTSRAVFVGETTGGNINHFGEIGDFTLSTLNLRVTYSKKYWELWKGKKGGLKPDIFTTNTFSDFIAAKDEAIEKILNK